jgi:hypothetical protein
MTKLKTYRFNVLEQNSGWITVTASSEAAARKKAEKQYCEYGIRCEASKYRLVSERLMKIFRTGFYEMKDNLHPHTKRSEHLCQKSSEKA